MPFRNQNLAVLLVKCTFCWSSYAVVARARARAAYLAFTALEAAISYVSSWTRSDQGQDSNTYAVFVLRALGLGEIGSVSSGFFWEAILWISLFRPSLISVMKILKGDGPGYQAGMAIEWDRSWGKKRGRDGWVGDVVQTLITARRRGWSGDCQVALDFEVSFMNSLDLWSAISCSKRKKLSLVGVIYHTYTVCLSIHMRWDTPLWRKVSRAKNKSCLYSSKGFRDPSLPTSRTRVNLAHTL